MAGTEPGHDVERRFGFTRFAVLAGSCFVSKPNWCLQWYESFPVDLI
jgi:hypothetical protein